MKRAIAVVCRHRRHPNYAPDTWVLDERESRSRMLHNILYSAAFFWLGIAGATLVVVRWVGGATGN